MEQGSLELIGRHPAASNVALLVRVIDGDDSREAIYKPVIGERPLWDFPDGSLAERERAAYLVSCLGGFGSIPPTVLRDGPYGRGSVQAWVGSAPATAPSPVAVNPLGLVPEGHLEVLEGEGARGEPVVVSHPDDPDLRRLALLDVVLNNADRKGGHICRWEGQVYGIDNGLSLHAEPKLRTVLWGWAGDPLEGTDRRLLDTLLERLETPGEDREELAGLVTSNEFDSLLSRATELTRSGRFPVPAGDWPAIPWPPL